METKTLLKIFIKENDTYQHQTLVDKILEETKELNLAGITIYKAIAGYGPSKEVHSTKILRLSQDLPVIIEIIDLESKIDNAISIFDDIMKEANCNGLITKQPIEVKTYNKK